LRVRIQQSNARLSETLMNSIGLRNEYVERWRAASRDNRCSWSQIEPVAYHSGQIRFG
jgi:hypothetical protein